MKKAWAMNALASITHAGQTGPNLAPGWWSRGCRQTLTDWGIDQVSGPAISAQTAEIRQPPVGAGDCLQYFRAPGFGVPHSGAWRLFVKRAFGHLVQFGAVLLHVFLPARAVPQ